ncbi:MAG: hypothetical protein IIV72_09175 [Alistipes sp.]|nr:hypothetical protein [Alistipes sp.]
MKSLLKRFSLLLVMLGFASIAKAEEDRATDGFIRRAFRDMKESAKLQRQIDKANFRAVRLETKAFYEEQKRLSKPSVRTAAEIDRMQRELEVANKRAKEAQAKIDNVKQ